MTLREALKSANHTEVFRLINEKDQQWIAAADRPSLEQTTSAYTKVIAELLSKPSTVPYKMSWIVREQEDWYDKHIYIDVGLINHDYMPPAEGLKPWGGDGKIQPPEGYYDCNDEKYNKYYAAGFASWSEMIDTPIVNELNLPLEKVVAEMLWEITFYGWTEKKQGEFIAEIEKRLEEALEDEPGEPI